MQPELSYGLPQKKAQLETPADCLNFPRQFLPGVVSTPGVISPSVHGPQQAIQSFLLSPVPDLMIFCYLLLLSIGYLYVFLYFVLLNT